MNRVILSGKIGKDVQFREGRVMVAGFSFATTDYVKDGDNLIKDANVEKTIYTHGTFGKYGKINRFVKNEDIDSIDKSVVEYLNYIASKAKNALSWNASARILKYSSFLKEICCLASVLLKIFLKSAIFSGVCSAPS